MSFTLADLSVTPNPLASHYTRFRVADRLLLTGHSHQAWPDVGFEAQQQAWLDAAELVDDKWTAAAATAASVRQHWKRLLNDSTGDIALGQNTHELVTRLISALPLRQRPRLITTDGEFHTVRRQLDRLAEEGVEVVKAAARPVDTLAERLAGMIDGRAAGVLVSSVLYETAEIVPDLAWIQAACERHGSTLLVDAYHHVNVVPFDVQAMGLEQAFITGGGYKYCQLGEGNAFLRVPPGCALRPVLTGWFAEFDGRDRVAGDGAVIYAPGADRFAGATYDPVSHYRAAAVQQFHLAQGLTPTLLRELSRHQLGLLARLIEDLDVDPAVAQLETVPAGRRAGFLTMRSGQAAALVREMRVRGVSLDARGERVRVGPAPYLSEAQLRQSILALDEALKALAAAPASPRRASP